MCLKSLQFKLLEGMQLAAEICIPPSSSMCGVLVRKRVDVSWEVCSILGSSQQEFRTCEIQEGLFSSEIGLPFVHDLDYIV